MACILSASLQLMLCSAPYAQSKQAAAFSLSAQSRLRSRLRSHFSALGSLARLSPWSSGAVSALKVSLRKRRGKEKEPFSHGTVFAALLRNPYFCLVTFVFSALWRSCSRGAAGAGFRHLHFCRTLLGLRGFQAAPPSHHPTLASRALSRAW